MYDKLQFITDFYQKSWTNLLWVIGAVGFVISIVWPTFVFLFNREKGKNYEDKLNNIFNEKKTELDNLFAESIKKIDEKTRDLDDRINNIENNQNRLFGIMFFGKAQDANNPFEKILSLMFAFKYFIISEDINYMTIVYQYMSPFFQNKQTLLNSDTISTEQKHMLKTNVEDVLNTLKQKSEKIDYTFFIDIF